MQEDTTPTPPLAPQPPVQPPQPVYTQPVQTPFLPTQSKPKSRLKPLIIAVVVLMLLGGGFFVFKSFAGGTKTVQAGGFKYSITSSKALTQLTRGGKTYVRTSDGSGHELDITVGKSTFSTYECKVVASSSITVVATPVIEGTKHNLCYSTSLNAYVMNFTHDNEWYYLALIPKVKAEIVDRGTVIKIASSVKISK